MVTCVSHSIDKCTDCSKHVYTSCLQSFLWHPLTYRHSFSMQTSTLSCTHSPIRINEHLHFDNLYLYKKEQQQQFCRLTQHSLELTMPETDLRATSAEKTLLFIHSGNVLGHNAFHCRHQPLQHITAKDGIQRTERCQERQHKCCSYSYATMHAVLYATMLPYLTMHTT